jgi:hypothetical protein
MSKLQNIKSAILKASDNDATKAIKYLLWYIESVQLESRAILSASSSTGASQAQFLGLAMRIEAQRKRVDNREIEIEEYESEIKSHSKYAELMKHL